MGIIRGGILAIVSGLLLVAFVVANLLLTISLSLNYPNVQENMQSVASDFLDVQTELRDRIVQETPEITLYCESYDNYVMVYRDRNIIIPCAIFNAGPDSIIEKGVNDFIKETYYTDYNCEFFDCFSRDELPFFLISAQTQQYFYQKFNTLLLAIGGLAIVGFLVAQRKSNFFLLTAILLILASLPFAKFDWIVGLAGDTAGGILNVFFAKAYDVFWASTLVGIILFAIGLLLKLFRIGFKISTIFQKKEGESGKEKQEVKIIIEKKEDKKSPLEKTKKEDKKPSQKKEEQKPKKKIPEKKKPSQKRKNKS